jgi:hypothetical protein
MPMDMETVATYRGRKVTAEDVAFIRELIATHPDASRHALSRKLCEAWGWVQPNGALRDMVCRGLMLALHQAGHIALPEPRRTAYNPFVERPRPAPVLFDSTPIRASLRELGAIEIRQVRRTGDECVFNSLIEMHHYLGYTQPVGEHLKYIAYVGTRPIACFAWGSAPRHIGPRDRFIGWDKDARRRNIRLLAYNSRFLILPWVQVRHLASYLLGRMAREIGAAWERVYSHPIYYLETFVDTSRFRGTCYRASNWVYLGKTTGRGKDDQTNRPNRTLKDILGYPLHKHFRELLGAGS